MPETNVLGIFWGVQKGIEGFVRYIGKVGFKKIIKQNMIDKHYLFVFLFIGKK